MQPTNPPVRAKRHQYLHVLQPWVHLQPPGFPSPTRICTHSLPSELLCLSFSKSLFLSLWWIPHELHTSANYQYFSLDCSLGSQTDCSLVNHQNNNKNNNVLAQNTPSKFFEGCGEHRVVFACHRLLLKTKKWLTQMKVLGVETELEVVMTGLGGRRSNFWLLCSDIQSMCWESDSLPLPFSPCNIPLVIFFFSEFVYFASEILNQQILSQGPLYLVLSALLVQPFPALHKSGSDFTFARKNPDHEFTLVWRKWHQNRLSGDKHPSSWRLWCASETKGKKLTFL